MTIPQIISYLGIASMVFAGLAVICFISAIVTALLFRPFRQQPEVVIIQPPEEQIPKQKRVVTRVDPADLQAMNRLFKIPKTNPAGWQGSVNS